MRFCEIAAMLLVGLLMVPCAIAADGPALAQIRTELPTPGVVLADHEDPATLIQGVAEGSSAQVVDLVKDAAMPIDKALRVNVTRQYETAWSVQVMSQTTQAPIKKGDVVFLSCWLRAPEVSGGQSGLAAIYLQTSPDWRAVASVIATCEREWKQVYAIGVADRDYPAGALQVTAHVSQQKQVIELAGLVVLDLGTGIDLKTLPRTHIVWRGMEADAPWRAKAQERIEKYRMADITVQVLDAAGKPVAGVPVHVKQQKRAFTIGSFTGGGLMNNTPDAQKMRDTYLRLFNRATSPIYWADWGWPNQKVSYLATAKWLSENHFTIRGHVMVYPTFQNMPADVVKLKDDPEKFRQRILQQIDEISEATKPYGFREYDVTNELRECTDVTKVLGRDVVVEWFAEARKHLPNAKMSLNENTILTNAGATKANQDLLLDWYRFLKSKGQAPDVLGFQGHFGEGVTDPDVVMAILDRFANETDAELQITEFDLNTLDEEAQAAYTRDFLTVVFSHPRITGFNMWGFWEGDHWLPRSAFYRKDWSPKPNGKALEELLTKTWWTDREAKTDAQGRATVKAFLGEHEVSAMVNGAAIQGAVTIDKPSAGAMLQLRVP